MPVLARELKKEDVPEIDRMFKNQSDYGVHGLENLVANKIFEVNGKVRGYGTLKIFVEGSLLIDSTMSQREKVEVVHSALRNMILEAKDAGIEQLYVTTTSESYSQILRNKLGFKVVPGELLLLDLSSEEE